MLVKLAIVLLFTLAQTVVLVGSTSTGLVRAGHFIKADGKGEKETHSLRKMKKGQVDESIALQDGDTIDMDDSPIIPGLRALRRENNSKNWNHGTNEVAAKQRYGSLRSFGNQGRRHSISFLEVIRHNYMNI
jgi:hypothetical protein